MFRRYTNANSSETYRPASNKSAIDILDNPAAPSVVAGPTRRLFEEMNRLSNPNFSACRFRTAATSAQTLPATQRPSSLFPDGDYSALPHWCRHPVVPETPGVHRTPATSA